MMIKKIHLALALLVALCACKKETTKIVKLDGNYVSSNSAEVKQRVMYTKDGVSDNEAVIQKFLNTFGGQSTTASTANKEIKSNVCKLSITGDDANISLFTSTIAGDRVKNFSGKVQDITDDEFMLRSTKRDTAFVMGYNNNWLKVTKPVTPEDEFIRVSAATGYQDAGQLITLSKQRIVLKNNELYLPMLIYAYKWTSGSWRWTTSNGVYNDYNIANPQLQQLLGVTDTVVVQQFLIKLKKQ